MFQPMREIALLVLAAASRDAMGRPVGVVVDKKGALLVADDVGNVIWRVTAAGS